MNRARIELLLLRAAHLDVAIAADRVVRAVDAAEWGGPAPTELAAELGAKASGGASHVVVLATETGERPFQVQGVGAKMSVPADDVAPLCDRVRSRMPALLALVTLPTGPTLVVDADALGRR